MATRYTMTGTVAAAGAAILAVLIALSPSERAQSLGLTQHGALITAQDAGAADAVATVAVSPGTVGQVLTVSDAGLPHWAAAAGGTPWGATVSDDPGTASGWTSFGWPTGALPGSTSVSRAGTTLTISATTGATGLAVVGRDATPIRAGAEAWDFAVRLDVTAGDGISPRGMTMVGFTADANNFFWAGLRSDRWVVAAYSVSGSYTNNWVVGPSSGQIAGGELWLRASRTPEQKFISWWGVGTGGALPTAWTRITVVDSAPLAAAVPTTSTVKIISGPYGEGARTSAWTVDVLAIRTTSAGSL